MYGILRLFCCTQCFLLATDSKTGFLVETFLDDIKFTDLTTIFRSKSGSIRSRYMILSHLEIPRQTDQNLRVQNCSHHSGIAEIFWNHAGVPQFLEQEPLTATRCHSEHAAESEPAIKTMALCTAIAGLEGIALNHPTMLSSIVILRLTSTLPAA